MVLVSMFHSSYNVPCTQCEKRSDVIEVKCGNSRTQYMRQNVAPMFLNSQMLRHFTFLVVNVMVQQTIDCGCAHTPAMFLLSGFASVLREAPS